MSVFRHIARLLRASSNGRTAASDAAHGGSSPSARADRPKRHLTLVSDTSTVDAQAAEVDNERQRYSAERYVELLKRVQFGGDETGRAEFSRYILGLSADAKALFFGEVDALIDAGRLEVVLTPEDRELVRQRVLARKEEIHADYYRPMRVAPKVSDAFIDVPEWPDIMGDDGDGEEDEEDQDQG